MKNEKMVGKPPSSSHKQQPAPPHRKSRWESTSNPQPPPPPDPKSSKSKPSPSSSRLAALDSSPIQPPLPPPPAGPSSSSAKPPLEPTPPLPLPAASPFQLPDLGPPPPPPPAYGFHMLERRTIVLADGSVRSYFALPPEEGFPLGGFGPEPGGLFPGADRPFRAPHPLSPDGLLHRGEFHGRGGGPHDYWSSLGLDGRGPPPQPETSQKRKYGEEDARDGYGRQRQQQQQQLFQYGNPNGYPSGSGDRADYMARPGSPRWREAMNSGRSGMDDMRPSKHMKVGGEGNDDMAFLQGMPGNSNAADYANTKHLDVNPDALKRAFLRFSKLLNEHASQRNNYLENGKNGPLRCLACDRRIDEKMQLQERGW